MNQNIKNLIARIFSMIASFLSTMIITHIVVQYIGKELYGFYQMSNDIINYATIITVALNSMSSRFITISYIRKEYDDANKYYNSVLYGNLVLAIVLAIPSIFFVGNLEKFLTVSEVYLQDVKILFSLMFVNFFATVCTSVLSAATFVKNRIDLDSYRTIEREVIRVIIVFVICRFFPPHIWCIGVAMLVGTIFVALRNYYYTIKLVPEIKLLKRKYFNKKNIIELICSGFWNSLTQLGQVLRNGVDLIIANQFIDSVAMGTLSVAKTLPKYLMTAMTTVASVFTPSVMIAYAEKDKVKLISTIYKAIKVCALISICIEVIIIVLGQRLYTLWVPGQDSAILTLLSVVSMAGYIVLMPMQVLWTIFTATNKVKISSIYLLTESLVTISIVFALLNMTNNRLIKLIIIAGVSSVFELIRGLTFLPLVSAYLMGIKITTFFKPLLKILIAFVVCIGICSVINFIPSKLGWIGFIILCGIEVAVSIGISFIIMFSRNEKQELIIFIKEKIGIRHE